MVGLRLSQRSACCSSSSVIFLYISREVSANSTSPSSDPLLPVGEHRFAAAMASGSDAAAGRGNAAAEESASPQPSLPTGAVTLSKGTGELKASTTTLNHLQGLVTQGFLPERCILSWLVVQPTDRIPRPPSYKLVIHTSFICRGLSLPVYRFGRGILTYYCCQLHHLTPNGVLHLARFITLCECFLGKAPHFGPCVISSK